MTPTPASTKPTPKAGFFLPVGYRERPANLTLDVGKSDSYWSPERIANAGRFQTHVYRLAARLIRAKRLGSLLDVGCGPATKLKTIIAPVCSDVEGLDQPSGIAAAVAQEVPAKFTPVDLEHADLKPWRTFDIIVCADVLEHLVNPDPMLQMIKRFCHQETLIVLSTPERLRLRGRTCNSSDKPEHVREWSKAEFIRFVKSRGFRVLRSRLYPQSDAPRRRELGNELLFRVGLKARSSYCCHAVVCKMA
jgi:2-polyprenyl-6-hydroxyphenyl methylase/3-demethylubiquinone-9 3-methyltransferase